MTARPRPTVGPATELVPSQDSRKGQAVHRRIVAATPQTGTVLVGRLAYRLGFSAEPSIEPVGLHVARARHPATRAGRPDPLGLARRVADQLAAAGVCEHHVAAACLATRGLWGLDRPRFAATLGLPEAAVTAVEAGHTTVAALPVALLRATPFPDLLARVRATGAGPAATASSPPAR